jgi:hypothetical protein
VWVRATGDELVIVAGVGALALRPEWAPAAPAGLVEVAQHALSTPGRRGLSCPTTPTTRKTPPGRPAHRPRNRPPRPRPRFWPSGPVPQAWLIEAAAAGTVRVRAKMAAAVELAALVGRSEVDAALGVAAAGRFAKEDLPR